MRVRPMPRIIGGRSRTRSCQGLSADRGLLLTRLDVLGPATMIEEVFIEREDGRAAYTSYGSSHLQILSKYRELIAGLAAQLREDASHVDPTRRQTLDGARVGGASTSQRGTRTTRTFDGMGRKYLQPTDDRPRRAREPRRCAECIWPPQRANVRRSGRSHHGFRPRYPSAGTLRDLGSETRTRDGRDRISEKSGSERPKGRAILGERRVRRQMVRRLEGAADDVYLSGERCAHHRRSRGGD
jgi:hypothetical protein